MQIYDPTAVPTVQSFMDDESFLRLIMGPFGSGKSTGCVQELMKIACNQAPSEDGIRRTRFAVVRNTFPQLRDTTLKTWLDWYPDKFWGKMNHSVMEYNMRFRAEDGTEVHSEILFRALDRPDQVSNLLSLELTYAWFNECREIDKNIWEAMQGRVGRFPAMKDGGCTSYGVIADTNPPDTDSWIYDLFEKNDPDNAKAFYQPSGLSPEAENLANLPPDYYKNLATGKSQDYIRVYIHGMYGYVQTGKPVYPEYKDEVHASDVVAQKGVDIYRGWDFGLTPACVWVQVIGSRVLIIDEMTSERMGIAAFLDDVLTYHNSKYADFVVAGDIGDPAGGQAAQTDERTVFQIMWDKGVMVEPGPFNVTERLEPVRGRLNSMRDGVPNLLLSRKNCPTIRKGFQGKYCYRRIMVSAERFADTPDKNQYSHIMDATGYIIGHLFSHSNPNDFKPPRVVGGYAGKY